MPTFSSCCHTEEYICQVCGGILCSTCKPPEWRTDITGKSSFGNVCPQCKKVVHCIDCDEAITLDKNIPHPIAKCKVCNLPMCDSCFFTNKGTCDSCLVESQEALNSGDDIT